MSDQVPIGSAASHVLFSCRSCGAKDEVIEVAPRKPGEALREWLGNLMEIVGIHHQLNHPSCSSERCDLKIPMLGPDDDVAGLGAAGWAESGIA